jgi:hypothetical protein
MFGTDVPNKKAKAQWLWQPVSASLTSLTDNNSIAQCVVENFMI